VGPGDQERAGLVSRADRGQGAPLVPFADQLLFADGTPRAILNIGGIANVTLLATARAEDVIAFDTGPGNMVIDQLARKGGNELDRDGAAAARGHVDEAALRETVVAAARDTGRWLRLVESRSQARDHPVHPAMPETRYLKCLIFGVE